MVFLIECLSQGIVLDTKKGGNFMQGLLQGNVSDI